MASILFVTALDSGAACTGAAPPRAHCPVADGGHARTPATLARIAQCPALKVYGR